MAPSGAQGGSKWCDWNWHLALRQPLGCQLVPKRPSCSPRASPRAPWRHPNGHKMTPKELQIRAWAPKIGPRAPKIDPQGAQTDPQTFKMDTLSSKSRPPRLPQSTPWSRFSVLCSQSSVLLGRGAGSELRARSYVRELRAIVQRQSYMPVTRQSSRIRVTRQNSRQPSPRHVPVPARPVVLESAPPLAFRALPGRAGRLPRAAR